MTSEIRTKDNLRRTILGKILTGFFVTVYIPWLEHFPKFSKQRVWNNNVLGGNFSKS